MKASIIKSLGGNLDLSVNPPSEIILSRDLTARPLKYL